VESPRGTVTTLATEINASGRLLHELATDRIDPLLAS
jgi:hypothetical protein